MTNADYTDINQYRDVESLNYYQILLERGKTKEEALKVLSCRSRDNGRTPMQWDGTENAGFTSGTPWIGCPENYREINASVQVEDEDSVFHFYRELIALRKRKKVVAEGRIEFLCDDQPEVFAYRRSLKGEELLVVNNFTSRTVTAGIVMEKGDYVKILGNYAGEPEKGTEGIWLRPFETSVWERK